MKIDHFGLIDMLMPAAFGHQEICQAMTDAGYCLDAPDFLAAGSTVSVVLLHRDAPSETYAVQTTFQRGST